MRALLLVVVASGAGCSKAPTPAAAPVPAADDFTAEDAKSLIPEAAGFSLHEGVRFYEFVRFDKDGSPMKFQPVNGHSLSWILLMAVKQKPDAPKNPTSFKYLLDPDKVTILDDRPVMASEIVTRAIFGPKDEDGARRAYVSFIHPEYITGCTCEVDGATAKGIVAFKVDNVYEGKVEYTARKRDDLWRIEEFRLPDYKITTALGADGKWVKKEPSALSE